MAVLFCAGWFVILTDDHVSTSGLRATVEPQPLAKVRPKSNLQHQAIKSHLHNLNCEINQIYELRYGCIVLGLSKIGFYSVDMKYKTTSVKL